MSRKEAVFSTKTSRKEAVLSTNLDKALKKQAGEVVLPAEAGKEPTVLRVKKDVMQHRASAPEYHMLFQGDKYDKPIEQIKEALARGTHVVNVVSPGYGSEPATGVTDLIISTALQPWTRSTPAWMSSSPSPPPPPSRTPTR